MKWLLFGNFYYNLDFLLSNVVGQSELKSRHLSVTGYEGGYGSQGIVPKY